MEYIFIVVGFIVIVLAIGSLLSLIAKAEDKKYSDKRPSMASVGISDYSPTKSSKVVIVISGIMLTISIIASIVCFVACSYQHDDTLQIVLGIIGGYNLLQGFILFALMFGVGHILKENEEINDTNKKISEKMDDLIRILKVKENE